MIMVDYTFQFCDLIQLEIYNQAQFRRQLCLLLSRTYQCCCVLTVIQM